MKLDDQQLATVLAALRFYQEEEMADSPANRSEAIHDIATDGDRCISLDSAGIDELCEYLNSPPADPIEQGRTACRAMLDAWEEQFGEGTCDCMPEPQNQGHVCQCCLARNFLATA